MRVDHVRAIASISLVAACSSDASDGAAAATVGAGGSLAVSSSSAAVGGSGGMASSTVASSAATTAMSSSTGMTMVLCELIPLCFDPRPGDRDPTNDCYTCAISAGGECEEEGTECATNPDCVELIECMDGCSDVDCVAACQQAHPSGYLDLANMNGCVCLQGCPGPCASPCSG